MEIDIDFFVGRKWLRERDVGIKSAFRYSEVVDLQALVFSQKYPPSQALSLYVHSFLSLLKFFLCSFYQLGGKEVVFFNLTKTPSHF